MKYAVIKTGGKQYKVREGEEILVEKLEGKKGDKIEFGEVFLLVEDGEVKIGRPMVKGARVKAKILAQTKGEKIRVVKFKAKSRYRRTLGHRQKLTKLRIEKIVEK